MTREEMIEAIEGEISRLEQVRGLLQRSTSSKFTAPESTSRSTGAAGKRTRTLSPEARKRIAQAQKRRWAKQRRETAGDKRG